MGSDSKVSLEKIQFRGLESLYDQFEAVAIGGMAEIYRARQIALDRPVAIKRMKPEFRSNRDLIERFRREAKSSGNLLHHNLAHVYDFVKTDVEHFIVMEWIDGFDLAELIEKRGPLPFDVAAMIGIKILSGLAVVHSHGMVHRDIKPDNIRINNRGEVKVMDFGIALDPTEQNLTVPGTLIGSPHYLSPEQIVGEKVDGRADLFSFGVTFYEMLTAKRPFFETQNESVYMRIKKGEFIAPESIREGMPAIFKKIISQCLEVRASKRPLNSHSLVQALTQYLLHNASLEFDERLRHFILEKDFSHKVAATRESFEKTPAPKKQISIPKWVWLAAAILFGTLIAYFK
jgi:serine/threonine protein kinase